MDSFHMLEYAAWAISGLLGLYMLIDMVMTDRKYSEDFLTSSKEGEIDEAFIVDPTHQGGRQ